MRLKWSSSIFYISYFLEGARRFKVDVRVTHAVDQGLNECPLLSPSLFQVKDQPPSHRSSEEMDLIRGIFSCFLFDVAHRRR
jgi:hypothetical protein